MQDPTQRFPMDDEQQEDKFIFDNGNEDIVFENEDSVFQEQDKFEQKMNQYFDPENQRNIINGRC